MGIKGANTRQAAYRSGDKGANTRQAAYYRLNATVGITGGQTLDRLNATVGLVGTNIRQAAW